MGSGDVFFPLFWGSSLQRVWQTEGGADGWWASFLETDFANEGIYRAMQQGGFSATCFWNHIGKTDVWMSSFESPFVWGGFAVQLLSRDGCFNMMYSTSLEDLGWRVQRKPAVNRNRPSYKVHNKFCWFSVERGFSIFLVQSIGYFPRSKWVLCLFLPSSSRQVVLDCMLLEGWVCFKALRFICLYGNSCDSAARVKVAPISAFEPDVFPSCSGIVWSVVQRLVEV